MNVGERIRAARTERGITVAALAERSGLSKGLISQVETGKTSPSIATLEKLADGLGIPAAYLLLKDCDAIKVVREAERTVYHFGPEQIKVAVLTSASARAMRAILVEFPPGTSTGNAMHAHAGEEWHLVLEGEVTAIQADREVRLHAGDTFHWKGCIPHRVINTGTVTAKVLAVTSAGVMEALGEESEI